MSLTFSAVGTPASKGAKGSWGTNQKELITSQTRGEYMDLVSWVILPLAAAS
jgi:hypothetical protein